MTHKSDPPPPLNVRTLHRHNKNKRPPNVSISHLNMYMNMCIVMYMNIYITPQNEKKLREWSDKSPERSMSGLVNTLLEQFLMKGDASVTYYDDGKPGRKATFGSHTENTPTPKKIEEKIISEAAPREMFRTTKDVLMEINTLEKEMSESVNQDPEWWNDMAGKKQALWDEYHTLKEE